MTRKNGDIGTQTDRRDPSGPGLIVVDGKVKPTRGNTWR